METDKSSGLKEYCIGIVIETKALDTDTIKVWPSEELSLAKGKLGEMKETRTESMPDSQGNETKSTVEYGAAIEAKWVLGESNRITSPDVVHGESVVIYRFSDTDEYYWRPLWSSEASLRRKEHVIYAYSNLKDGIGSKEFDQDTSYWTMISTLLQLVHFHTSDNDGEKVKYDVKFNAKDGIFSIEDALGNIIEVLSTEAIIRFTNKEGSVYEMDKGNINETCTGIKTTKAASVSIQARSGRTTADSIIYDTPSFKVTSPLLDNPQVNDHEVRITRLESFHPH